MASKKKSKGRRPPAKQGGRPKGAPPRAKTRATQPGGATAAGAPASGAAAKQAPAPKAPAPAPGQKAASPAAGHKRGGSTGRTRSGPTRTERLEAAQRARRRRAIRTRVMLIGIVVLVAFGIAGILVANNRSKAETTAKLQAGSCKVDTKTDPDGGTGNNHVPDPTYAVDPPAGGNHLAAAAPPGKFTTAKPPEDGNIVHSMEHGYVVLWYKPDLPPAEVARLETLAGKYPKDVLLVPRASLPTPVAATAWHHRALCGDVDDKALDLFVTTYRNKGPEKVPH